MITFKSTNNNAATATHNLILQHNTIERKTNKFIESNTRDEKKLRKHQQSQSHEHEHDQTHQSHDQSQLEPQHREQQQQLKQTQQPQNNTTDNKKKTTTSSTTTKDGTSMIGSGIYNCLNYMYQSINDWLYIKNFNFFCSVLRCGAVPRHIGVIMDGNRRFARREHIELYNGHKMGFAKMLDMCQWGLALGVQIISVYAFSIENFKRPKKEVDDLMQLANEKFEEMLCKTHKLQKMGVRIRVVGDLTHIPEKTKIILAKAVKATESNTKALLNICMSYTSHEEMLHSMKTLSKGVQDNVILTEDIDQSLFEKCLYIEEDLDILVRTSGEYRLSDFMLWQSCYSSSNFLKVLWPDFSCFHFFYIIFLYQSNYRMVSERQKRKTLQQQASAAAGSNSDNNDRVREFIDMLRKSEQDMFEEMSKCDPSEHSGVDDPPKTA
ncbi:hypothetical protein SAMD00019534_109130 [Acytostelium subglobosum LB1]|uniref:hypothetical protein n=1 Tax=Acytostelium subglobosum LB1 TaxID=1410327 RepID=UPI000644B31C|nr:hypothetical protein SAMD00019534_109130 [Acytostelium subglobosum LB1]GAM27737.1 hypothetical protein SAMD00019534_109130 [Acytostelium subglobosum LB1]|eukprot:XP_012749396.1 hypothetical protein SAMD00019534_109130 [Acytostelium subglobosum LB1]